MIDGLIEKRAREEARKAGVSFEFFWQDMNWRALIPLLNCGHTPVDESDVVIDFMLPPREAQDWARLHARNVYLYCSACRRARGNKSHQEWLDQMYPAIH